MPCTPSTTPMSIPSRSSTGPCSMCSSTNAWGTQRCARRRARVTDAAKLVPDGGAIGPLHGEHRVQRQQPLVDHASHHVRGEPNTFLVGEESHRERPPGAKARFVQGGDHLKAREHPERAVVATARPDGIDVRPGHHRCAVLASGSDAHDVADLVDGDREPELAHPSDRTVAGRPVLVAEGEPADAAAVDGADLRQGIDAASKTREIDAEIRRPGHRVVPPRRPRVRGGCDALLRRPPPRQSAALATRASVPNPARMPVYAFGSGGL